MRALDSKPSHMPNRLITILALLTCSLTLSGCGQKGPLYMPEESPAAAQPDAPQQQPDSD